MKRILRFLNDVVALYEEKPEEFAVVFCSLVMALVMMGVSIRALQDDLANKPTGAAQITETVYQSSEENICTDIVEETSGTGSSQEFTIGEVEYLCRCVEAEAGNQSELGRRLVCDVILNRFYSGKYTTLYEVIDEKNQFAVVNNGSINRVEPTESTIALVKEELLNRTNTDVLYFRTEHYHTFGTPLFIEGDHYFSE